MEFEDVRMILQNLTEFEDVRRIQNLSIGCALLVAMLAVFSVSDAVRGLKSWRGAQLWIAATGIYAAVALALNWYRV